MSRNFWKQARFGKGYSPSKTEPDDSELVWPEPVSSDENADEDDELDPNIDVVDLMSGNTDPKPHKTRGGYRVQAWRDDWVKEN